MPRHVDCMTVDQRLPSAKTLLLGVHSLCPGGTERVVSLLLESFVRLPALDVHCILYGRSPTCFYESLWA